MQVIRDPKDPIGMSALLIDWKLRRCNVSGCRKVPSVIVSPTDPDPTPVFALCEEHYQEGNKPGGTTFNLVWSDFDAFRDGER